jgi:rhodanese-related sulfurtransferase
MDEVRISPKAVKERMERGETVLFLDSRNPTAWSESDRMLPGAIRMPADEVDERAADIPRSWTVVSYCT